MEYVKMSQSHPNILALPGYSGVLSRYMTILELNGQRW